MPRYVCRGFAVHGTVLETLACPHCGSDCLHHGAVRTYNRDEDDADTFVTTIHEERVTTAKVASNLTRNPSSRRHGLTIAFGCENCGDFSELTLAQHKGATLIEWRFLVDDSKAGINPDLQDAELSVRVFYPPLAPEPADRDDAPG